MNEQRAFLERIVVELERAGVDYMITGSFASSLHGTPRATNDLDIVIDPSAEQLEQLVDALEPDLYVDRESARTALKVRRMFNVIQAESGWKADLIIRKDRDFSFEEFRRRLEARALGGTYFFASPEDTILAKLEWSRAGGSDRQLDDAAGIARVQSNLDLAYLERWAARLGVERLLERALGDSAG